MYEFTINAPRLRVTLHDAAGKRIGVAKFDNGKWRTESAEEAEAMKRAGESLVKSYGFACKEPPVPEPDEELTIEVGQEAADEKPAKRKDK